MILENPIHQTTQGNPTLIMIMQAKLKLIIRYNSGKLHILIITIQGYPKLIMTMQGNPIFTISIQGNPLFIMTIQGTPLFIVTIQGNPIFTITIQGTPYSL